MDDLIRKHFPENYGRAWVELLESPVSIHARMCYVAMTSFGSESRAGKRAIGRRMGVKSLSTVKLAQAELVAAGWMDKEQPGGGKSPAVWNIYAKPKRVAEDDRAVIRPTPGPYYGPPPGRITAPKQELNHEENQEQTATPSVPPLIPTKDPDPKASPEPKPGMAARGAVLAAFRAWWLAQNPGLKFVNGPGDGKLATGLVQAGITADDLAAPLAAWLARADAYTKDAGFPFWLFCREWPRLQAAAAKTAPTCQHPSVNWHTTFRDGTQAGTCNTCGKPVTQRPSAGGIGG